MGKKSRKKGDDCRSPPTKTQTQRETETKTIEDKLESLGLTAEYPEIARYLKIAADYVSDGCSQSGRIPINGVGRTLVYTLTTKPHLTCTATLV